MFIMPDCKKDTMIGEAQVNGPNSWIYGVDELALYGHELGHNFGLLHAGRKNDEYGDPTCVMGYCCHIVCFNIVHATALNWITPIPLTSTGLYPLNTVYTFNDFYLKVDNREVSLYEKTRSGGSDSLFHGIKKDFNLSRVQFKVTANGLYVAIEGTFPISRQYNDLIFVPLSLLLVFVLLMTVTYTS
jgi:hypothetical protein